MILLACPDGLHLLKRARTRVISLPLSFSYTLEDWHYKVEELEQILDFNNKEIMELAPKHARRDDLALKLFSLCSINTIKN